jgi:asparagine synthase (glutamine-hydrolysing)
VLKEELIRAGHDVFATHSDTEVLLVLYKLYGKEMLARINGMFAFAIYDMEKKELFLARDRMGKKPLYFSSTPDTFVFASELKAVASHPSVQKEIDLESLNRYLTFDYTPGPDSILKNISKLEPAHYLVVKDGRITEKVSYWQHRFTPSALSFSDAKSRFDELLDAATGRRLMSDVPLGIFLSGGLDSSTVAYYAQKNSMQQVKTFSIGFEDASYDEQDYARRVAEKLGTDHHVSVLTAAGTLELIDKIYPLVDEPFADASLIPTYYLSAFTRRSVTVALGGDGSDELLAGYPTFISDKFKNIFRVLPRPVIHALLALVNHLPASDKNISLDFKIRQFLRGFSSSRNHIHQLWLGSFLPAEKKLLLKKNIYDGILDKSGLALVDAHYEKCPSGNDFQRTAFYYYQTYLPDDILFKVDRASMYNSLEVRAPFLDVQVVELLNSLPKEFKQKGYSGKYLLKKLMEGRLPDDIIYRPKKGFGIPLSDWIRKDLRKSIEDCLLSENDFFRADYVRRILSEHQSGKFNHRKLIWNLYMFLYWTRQ